LWSPISTTRFSRDAFPAYISSVSGLKLSGLKLLVYEALSYQHDALQPRRFSCVYNAPPPTQTQTTETETETQRQRHKDRDKDTDTDTDRHTRIYELIVVAHQQNAPTAVLALLVAGAVKLVKQKTLYLCAAAGAALE
jgi:hypothetical protein